MVAGQSEAVRFHATQRRLTKSTSSHQPNDTNSITSSDGDCNVAQILQEDKKHSEASVVLQPGELLHFPETFHSPEELPSLAVGVPSIRFKAKSVDRQGCRPPPCEKGVGTHQASSLSSWRDRFFVPPVVEAHGHRFLPRAGRSPRPTAAGLLTLSEVVVC